MPNWCDNSLSLVGPTKELKRLRQAYIDGELFEAILPCPKELKGTTADGSTNEDLVKKHGHSDWYSFATTEWGTKWDIGSEDGDKCEEIVPNGNDDEIGETARWTFFFQTAWAPPIGVYEKLFEDGFEVYATYYEPGCDFAGIWEDGDDQGITLSDEPDKFFEDDTMGRELDNHYNILEGREMMRADSREEVQEWYEDGVKEVGLEV